ncbi:TMEM165/GDT1 family protein [Mycobacterium haemophilum]|uniref:GDT1 family protein n=1 Tax=Mycobacterium haemophilum TaxID=29311 RepID=A0A0I9U0Z2_9MYCO|nr:transmembrane protein [Mycobacterium haemophilum]KLO34038.1 transmembrane protein [Mycobacterium haemophilum]KLO35739.1 transmembrane protein [Mycobacterium haemophilum]KLO43718.1 transmembrane protein [Mycobacterium haemophilum]
MLAATLLSLGVVFLAELGDRSQLIALTYALRYRWWVVLTGVAIAAFMVHGVSVSIGHFLGATLPARPMAFLSAAAFFVFAVWAWREGATNQGGVLTTREPRFALLTVVSSFVLAEMSDKTTLATVTLASDHNWAGVWIGTTVGMVMADGLAIGVGILLHQRLPEQLLHVLASLLFLLFGLWMLLDSALGWRPVAIGVTAAVALAAAIVGTSQTLRRRRTRAAIAGRPRGAVSDAVGTPANLPAASDRPRRE